MAQHLNSDLIGNPADRTISLNDYRGTTLEKGFVAPDPVVRTFQEFHASLTPESLLKGEHEFQGVKFVRRGDGWVPSAGADAQ